MCIGVYHELIEMWNTAHMKESYNQRKSLIKNSLSNIDSELNNKIVFDENGYLPRDKNKRKYNSKYEPKGQNSTQRKYELFDEKDVDQDEINFRVKNQFEGKKGQKLLELQSKFTTDKRFNLDSRFLDENDTEGNQNEVDDEKRNQLDILESVLGMKMQNNGENTDHKKFSKGMLRFDPSKPDHSKFEMKEKKHACKWEEMNNKETTIPPVEVSKEKFFKVDRNLKESLKENKSFSLLSMFGTAEEKDIEVDEIPRKITKNKTIAMEQNPFRYDSSDTEDDERENPKRLKTIKIAEKQLIDSSKILRGENFFFKEEDERLIDGLSFLTKFRTEGKSERFSDTRREVKKLMRAKVRNIHRNNRPFQRKFGSHKRIKTKRANKS